MEQRHGDRYRRLQTTSLRKWEWVVGEVDGNGITIYSFTMNLTNPLEMKMEIHSIYSLHNDSSFFFRLPPSLPSSTPVPDLPIPSVSQAVALPLSLIRDECVDNG